MIMANSTDGPEVAPVIKVLIALHPGMDAMDFVGPVEVLDHAQHEDSSKAFACTTVAAEAETVSAQGIVFKADIAFKEAYARLGEFDILLIPGGGVEPILKQKTAEPLPLIAKFSALQQHNCEKERTLISICTGALLLAQAGILHGLTATTHPDHITKFLTLAQTTAARDLQERADVVEERYVVNNLRFDLDEPDSAKYMSNTRRKSNERRMSMGRKGSDAWRTSNMRRESNARRAGLRLGGLRVITTGGGTSGLDAGLYLVGAMVSEEAAERVEGVMGWEWRRGVVVDGLDI